MQLVKNILQKGFILLILISIYISPLFEGFFEITIVRPIALVLGYMFFFLSMFFSKRFQCDNYILFYVIVVLGGLIISTITGDHPGQAKTYIGILTALFILVSRPDYFEKAIKFITLATFFMVLYEFITREYIYTIFRMSDGRMFELNPKFFEGAARIFRSKGLFEGPLTLTNFAAAVSFYFKDNLKYIIICIVMCFMANGRLGILITSLVFIFYFIRKYNLQEFMLSRKFLIFLGIIVAGIIYAINVMDVVALERLIESFDSKDRGNMDRFNIWGDAITEFSNYNIVEMIFGNLGHFKFVYGHGPESGWLMVLLDLGVVGLLAYLIPVVSLFILSVKKRTGHFLYLMVLFAAMAVQTFHSGASPNLLYWIILFYFFLELSKKNQYFSAA